MFWRFGGYANISTIETILDKPDFTLEDLLDESDLIQELKQHNSKLIEYLREDHTLEKLLEYVVAPKLQVFATPEDSIDEESKGKNRLLPFSRPRASSRATDLSDNGEEEQEKKRNRYALVASEVLSSDTWSIYEALTENRELISRFWKFLERPAPLDPLQASYFTKVNESLFEKKTDDMMEFFRTIPNVVPDLLKHVECPMTMDLLLKIIALDRNEGGQGIVEWLYAKDIIPTLLSCLDPRHSWVIQTAAGDFIKAIITISANASQNEQQCIGPNELTRQLVSEPCVEQLISYMLEGGNPLTVGVGIVIEVIRKNNSDYDPDVGSGAHHIPSSRDPIYLGHLLRLFAQNIPKFMTLIMEKPAPQDGVASTFGQRLEPLGFDRFKTCELMAELLHCSNMGLLNEPGSDQLIATRDAERHRLRTEGRLGPMRDDGLISDELTMRMTHGSVHDESRRLEVINADDDGFEEVEPSREMSEDTSHEFIKAEDDIGGGPPVSFLEKDEDDFVDEPLSSPRLSVAADKINEQCFDDADLAVAPLSPTKSTFAQEASQGEEQSNTDDAAPAPVSDPDTTDKLVDKHNETPEPESGLSDLSSAIPEAKSPGGLLEPDESRENSQNRGLSPHPEDLPAPLFSSSNLPQPATSEQNPYEANAAANMVDVPVVYRMTESEPHIETNEPRDGNDISGKTETGESSEIHDINASANGSPMPKEEPQLEVTLPVEPVVGDYLKMQFVEHRVVPAILSFFFSYPWNNFLHNVVYDIVQQVFNGPMDRGYNPTLAVSLFEDADVTAAIIRGQEASDASQARDKTRMGYMGHLTLIAEEVVKFTERHPPELLSEMVLDKVMSQDWINYVEGALAETRERDNAILGGVRPEIALNRASVGGGGGGGLSAIGFSGLGNTSVTGSNALAEAGLNGGIEMHGGGGHGIGPFAISAGTSMSGFGSSSDEDDDEGDGEEEDANSEFRAYADTFSNADKSMSPPSIPPPPPPPPPLNIPPSRARLQLAARLAMQKNNNNNNNSNNQPTQFLPAMLHHNGGEEPNGQERRNQDLDEDDDDEDDAVDPFQDGDDDIDDEDDDEDDLNSQATPNRGRGRGSWWRTVVGRTSRDSDDDDADDDDEEEEEDEEFGDFALAEDDKSSSDIPVNNLVLRPLPVHPTKESSRGLSGLWPFGSRSDSKTRREESGSSKEEDEEDEGVVSISASTAAAVAAEKEKEKEKEKGKGSAGEGDGRAVEVKEARSRTSIEEPDEDEDGE